MVAEIWASVISSFVDQLVALNKRTFMSILLTHVVNGQGQIQFQNGIQFDL